MNQLIQTIESLIEIEIQQVPGVLTPIFCKEERFILLSENPGEYDLVHELGHALAWMNSESWWTDPATDEIIAEAYASLIVDFDGCISFMDSAISIAVRWFDDMSYVGQPNLDLAKSVVSEMMNHFFTYQLLELI